MLPVLPPAVLALADGTTYCGYAIGATGSMVGEVVFNTAMSGYQEILTDPSYCRQLVTLTYPHIGNTGVTLEDEESTQIQAAGLLVRDVPRRISNWRAEGDLSSYLSRTGTVGMAGLDTRALTRHLREKGAQAGCLVAAEVGQTIDVAGAIEQAKAFGGLAGLDLAREVSVSEAYEWTEGTWVLGEGHLPGPSKRFKVVALDFGVKRNILRLLADRGCEVIVLPAQATLSEVMAHGPDGVFFSNGPGDPEPCDYAIELAQALMAKKMPLFGICLGHQIMALASGARTMKMKNGHHGANHPVKDHDTGRVFITSQNHGFAVDSDSLPENLRLTHTSLFDGTVQGLARTDVPAFCFQGHPEASPGPHDIRTLFDRFCELMTSKAPLEATSQS
ncbi:MAG: glutamine-hydrolyzing carbamoyl-phosphate synthase small subunit [Burkholderiaceae bacterium]